MIALLYLASGADKTASVREVAQSCHVPETLLSKIMQSMKNEGFVSAVYGNQGGYRLNKALSEINLLDLTRVLDGPIQVAECLSSSNALCPVVDHCLIVSPMNTLNQKIIDLFKTTSLEALFANKEVRQ